MEIILLEDVKSLGKKGEKCKDKRWLRVEILYSKEACVLKQQQRI